MNASKVSIVSGGRRGIGLAIVKKLISDGYFCVIADVLEEGEIPQCAEFVRCDISNPGDRENLCRHVDTRHKRLDLLVNNAGVACKTREDILTASEKSFDRLIRINLKGTFFMTQLFSNLMINYKKADQSLTPRIVNISSISAYTSSTSRGEYCISKAGISMITKLFADRLAEYYIPVFEVRPGIILTDMTLVVQEKYQKMINEGVTPFKRFGMPEDVADVVSAAASGRLDFGTGTVLNADGGFSIRRL